MTKTCLLPLLATALFFSGCDSVPADSPQEQAAKPPVPEVVDLKGLNLLPVYVASVDNPDDAFIHEMLRQSDSDYARGNKFYRQDTFQAKKAKLLKDAAAVKGKIVLVRLDGTLRSDDYDQNTKSYSLHPNISLFSGQVLINPNDPYNRLKLVIDNRPARFAVPEEAARAIAAANYDSGNVELVAAANVVSQDAKTVHAEWDQDVGMNHFCYLHLSLIDAVLFAKSSQGGLVKIGEIRYANGAVPAKSSPKQ